MARPSKTDQELGYLKDFWEEVRTTEADYHGSWSMEVWPSNRPGVMTYRMIFAPLMGAIEYGLGKQTLEFTYPNAEQSTMSGFLWRKAIALGRQVKLASEEERSRKINGG
jgi:hypothetical protein